MHSSIDAGHAWPQVRIGRPTTIEQMQTLVKLFDHVKAAAVGHSWWREQFCAGGDERSINILTTEMQNTSLMCATQVCGFDVILEARLLYTVVCFAPDRSDASVASAVTNVQCSHD